MSATSCWFPADMPMSLRRKLMVDVAEFAWFSVNVREDLDGEYERVSPWGDNAAHHAVVTVDGFLDLQLAIDKGGGR